MAMGRVNLGNGAAKVKKMRGGGMTKKMRGGGMAKKMRGGGMTKKMRGGGMVKKLKEGGASTGKGALEKEEKTQEDYDKAIRKIAKDNKKRSK